MRLSSLYNAIAIPAAVAVFLLYHTGRLELEFLQMLLLPWTVACVAFAVIWSLYKQLVLDRRPKK